MHGKGCHCNLGGMFVFVSEALFPPGWHLSILPPLLTNTNSMDTLCSIMGNWLHWAGCVIWCNISWQRRHFQILQNVIHIWANCRFSSTTTLIWIIFIPTEPMNNTLRTKSILLLRFSPLLIVYLKTEKHNLGHLVPFSLMFTSGFHCGFAVQYFSWSLVLLFFFSNPR